MITKKFCPDCGSENVQMMSGGVTGNWICKECGYIGNVAEKEILGRDVGGEE